MLVLISGPSGAGKSTLVEAILRADPALQFAVSSTTRPRRPDEKNGVQYYFVDEAEFDRLIAANTFVEWALVHRYRYGTRRDHLQNILDRDRVPLLDLDVQGGAQVIAQYGPGVVSIFVFPPSWEALEARLRGRGTDDERVIQTRLANARWEVGFSDRYEYFLVNDVLEEALAKLQAILTAERCRRFRLGDPPLTSGGG
jgi:guanylate kinase